MVLDHMHYMLIGGHTRTLAISDCKVEQVVKFVCVYMYMEQGAYIKEGACF